MKTKSKTRDLQALLSSKFLKVAAVARLLDKAQNNLTNSRVRLLDGELHTIVAAIDAESARLCEAWRQEKKEYWLAEIQLAEAGISVKKSGYWSRRAMTRIRKLSKQKQAVWAHDELKIVEALLKQEANAGRADQKIVSEFSMQASFLHN